jgi:sRNA-binding regulator protein Hfq
MGGEEYQQLLYKHASVIVSTIFTEKEKQRRS